MGTLTKISGGTSPITTGGSSRASTGNVVAQGKSGATLVKITAPIATVTQEKEKVTAPTIDRRASAAKRAEKQAAGTMAQFIRDYNSDSSKPFLIGRDISGKTSIRSKVDYESMIADLKKQQTAAIYEAERAVTTEQKSSAENLAVKLAGEMQQLREKQSSEANEYYRLENELQRYSLSKNQEAGKTYDSARTLQKDLEALDRAIMLYNNADPMDTEDPFVVAEDVMEKYGITAQDFANASMYGDLKLSNIRKQIAKELETASAGLEQEGYQVARMSQYQDTLEKAKQYQQESEARQQWAKEHPIVSSVSSVLRSPLQGVEFLELAAENIGNDPKDLKNYVAPNVYDMVNTNAVNQVRGTVSKEIEENTDWELFGQNVASFLYQTGMSAVDSAAQVAAFGPAATVFMGGAAASSTASDIIQRGGTSTQAFWGGLAAGAAEAVFEKFSVDNLLKAKDVTSVKTLIREAVKQSGVEASEEMLTEIANIISDSMIMGEKGNYAQAVAAYEAQGMSRTEAEQKAMLDSIGQVMWAGAGGAISGGLTGGAYRAAGLMQYRASDYGQAESTVNAVNATLKKAGVEDPAAFYESVGVENPYLEAMTPEGKEFLSGAAEAYANLKKSAAQYAQTRQQQTTKTEPETMEAPRGNVLDRAVAEVRESGTLSNRTATEILSTPEAVQTLADSGLTLTSGMTQSQRRAAVKTAVERAALPDTIKNAMVDVGLSWAGNRPITEETQPAPEIDKSIAYNNADVFDGVIWNGNRHLFEQQGQQEAEQAAPITEQASTITQQAVPITEQQQRKPAMAAESQAVVNEQQTGSNNAIPGLYWAGSQIQPGIEQTDTMGYTGTEPGTEQTAQSERMTANETRADVSGGVAGRELSERAGEQAGDRIQSDTGRIEPATEQSRAAAGRQALGKNLGTERVSSKSLGLENGTENATVQVIPESQWDAALQETARWVRDETYKDVVFVLGPIEIETGGKTSHVRGVYLADKIIVQTDHASLTPEQIARHEEFHDITRRTPVIMRDLRQKIEDNYSVEELENIIQAYVKRMRHLLDLPENPTNEQLHQALLRAEEEVYADAYAGINAFGTNASQYQETVQEFANREKQQRQAQRQQEVQQETGPPEERYSLREEFSDEFLEWYHSHDAGERMTDGSWFTVGDTSAALRSIGVRDSTVYWRKSKAGYIMEEHPEMTPDIMVQIPQIIETPILVAKSKTQSDSITVFSELTANGKPVMVALNLTPMPAGGMDANFTLIASAYGRGKTNAKNLIASSEILYLDKNRKRTDTWLMSLGLQLPSDQPVYGPIGSVSYDGRSVKIQGVPYADLGSRKPSGGVERYSMEDEELDLDKLYEQEERARQDRIQQINKRLEKLTALDYQEQRFRESGVEALAADDREVRKLRKELSKLEGVAEVENKKTGEKKAVPVQPVLAKMEFRDNMLNLFSIPQSQRAEIGAVLDNFAAHVAKSGKIDERARSALFDRLYEEGVMQVAADEYLAMGREAVAGGRVYVPQEVKDEFGDDWNDFRRRLFANKIYAVDDQAAAGIDTWSAELSEVLPGLFEENVYDRKQALERILQVAEEGADQNLSLAEYTAQVAGETGVDVDTVLVDMERQMDYLIQKFASMANLETELRARPELLRAEANERVQAIREQRDRTVQKVIDHYNDILQRRTAEMEQAVGEARATAAQRVQKVREQRDRTVEKVQAHYNEMRERNVAQRERAIQEAREAASERVQRAREQRDRTVDRVREAAAERVQKTREQRDRTVDKVRESARQRVQRTRDQRDRIVERMKTHYTNIIYKQREQVEANNAKERARRKEMMERRKERIHLQSLQQETLKQLQWLSKNRNKAPEDLKAAFDEVLSDIDIYAVGAANEMNYSQKYGGTWADIVAMYKHARDFDPNFLPSQDLERIMARLDNAKIESFDIDALQDLYKAAVGLRTEFQNRNRVIADEKQRLFSEVYEDVEQEFKEAAGKYKGTKRDHLINRDQLNPMNYLQRMAGWNPDSTWYSMAKQLEAGEREVRRYKVNASLRLQEFLKEHKDWVAKADGQGKDAIWYELEVSPLTELNMGSKPVYDTEHPVTIHMTPSQKVHLYLESKSPDNLRHMLGGRTFVNKELYAKGKRKEALSQGTTVRLAPEDVKRIVSDMTDTELQLAKLLEDYYNQFAKQEINRVSNLLYGYDKAIGQNYAPIYTNQNYTQKEVGTYDATAEGVGNLKQRVVSKNPSYNISAFDAFERHVDQTAKFVGLSVPIRNWNTMLNWRTANNSMGDIITHKWGQEAQDYITDIIKRLQNSQFDPKDVASELGDKLQSQYTRAVFGFNWGTVAKQLGGLSVAAADLGRKNIPSLAHVRRVKNELINIYTPELAYRGMGYATMETKHLKEHPGWTERSPFLKYTIGGGAITAMDQHVVKSMWAWAENKVKKKYSTLEVGDEQQVQNGDSPFYKKVAEVFEQALYNTQPMADEMHVSALRKSKNVVARSVTMFRSDAMAAYNLMRKRMGEAAYYEKTGQTQKAKEAKRAVGTAAMYIAGNSLFAVLVNFVNNIIKYKGEKYKDEEEKRMTAWSVGSEMVLDMVQSLAGSAMAGGDVIAELIGTAISKKKWYGLDAPGIEQISELLESGWNTISGTYKIIADLASIAETENATVAEYWNRHWQEFAGAITGAAEQVTTMGFGFPASNLSAYIMGLISWVPFVGPKAKAELEGLTDITKKSSLADAEGTVLEVKVRQLMEHRLGGDQSMAAEEIARLYESGVPSASSAVFGDTPKEINDEKLTEGQQQVYDMAYRDLVNDALDDLMDSDSYIAADDETRCKMLKALYDYADDMAREAVVPGSVKLTTETGSLTEFGKADYLMESGLSLAEYIQLKSADAVDDAVDAVEAGEPVQQSMEVALLVNQAMDKLPKDATDLQKQEAAFDAVKPGQEEITAAVMVIGKDDMPKLELAYAYGVTPGMVTDFKARFDKVYGVDMNGRKITVTQERAEDIISEMIGYSSEERAILWQMQNKSWKWQKNPYNRQIAREFVEEAGWNEEQ